MKILRANHLGMCFGVRDAIALALNQPQPVSIFGDLVHNPTILSHLRSQGVRTVHQVAATTTPILMITAHGASQKTLNLARQSGRTIVEGTCPLVHFAHRAVARLVADGFHPVIIGKRDHVEVRGLTEDLAEFDVILTDDDVNKLQERPRFGVASQTTQPIDRVHHLLSLLQKRFQSSEIRFIDTVCQPTKQRQLAAIELAQQCDVVVVIGGTHSNNTRELVATCARHGREVFHVERVDDLRPDWFAHARTVGITAGTSTPDETIEAVEQWLIDFAEFQQKLAAHTALEQIGSL